MIIQNKDIDLQHAKEYWELRLEALKTHPEAFSSSYEDAVQTPIDEIEKRIKIDKDSYILGAFTEDNQLIGMARFKRDQGEKLQHKGMISGVYVPSNHRGKGIAKNLMKEILIRGKEIEGLKQINLSVISTNKEAVELYKGLGFKTYGIEKNSLIYKDQGYDEKFMVYLY